MKHTEVLESSLARAARSDNVLAAAEASAVADARAAAWATRVPCEHCPSYGIASLAGRWLCRECIDLIAGRNQTADAYPEMLRAATARLSESLANEERERHEALTLRALVKELEARLAACARAGCPTAAVPCEPRANDARLVRCWRCKHDVLDEMTVCMVGIGTQCKDAEACRDRLCAPVPCEPRANVETGDANVQIGPAHLVDEPTSEGDL